ncbi:hypothetical protein QYM36_003416 [Artemia franciscana]|uniref:Uncharacterized protein n=1 Tax=Artemia franciscana TaxID=6661 RepID=A0AA88IFV8_ARTSF|nr:hypothetical protein QYM36_003416 [Artemia franciscana]
MLKIAIFLGFLILKGYARQCGPMPNDIYIPKGEKRSLNFWVTKEEVGETIVESKSSTLARIETTTEIRENTTIRKQIEIIGSDEAKVSTTSEVETVSLPGEMPPTTKLPPLTLKISAPSLIHIHAVEENSASSDTDQLNNQHKAQLPNIQIVAAVAVEEQTTLAATISDKQATLGLTEVSAAVEEQTTESGTVVAVEVQTTLAATILDKQTALGSTEAAAAVEEQTAESVIVTADQQTTEAAAVQDSTSEPVVDQTTLLEDKPKTEPEFPLILDTISESSTEPTTAFYTVSEIDSGVTTPTEGLISASNLVTKSSVVEVIGGVKILDGSNKTQSSIVKLTASNTSLKAESVVNIESEFEKQMDEYELEVSTPSNIPFYEDLEFDAAIKNKSELIKEDEIELAPGISDIINKTDVQSSIKISDSNYHKSQVEKVVDLITTANQKEFNNTQTEGNVPHNQSFNLLETSKNTTFDGHLQDTTGVHDVITVTEEMMTVTNPSSLEIFEDLPSSDKPYFKHEKTDKNDTDKRIGVVIKDRHPLEPADSLDVRVHTETSIVPFISVTTTRSTTAVAKEETIDLISERIDIENENQKVTEVESTPSFEDVTEQVIGIPSINDTLIIDEELSEIIGNNGTEIFQNDYDAPPELVTQPLDEQMVELTEDLPFSPVDCQTEPNIGAEIPSDYEFIFDNPLNFVKPSRFDENILTTEFDSFEATESILQKIDFEGSGDVQNVRRDALDFDIEEKFANNEQVIYLGEQDIINDDTRETSHNSESLETINKVLEVISDDDSGDSSQVSVEEGEDRIIPSIVRNSDFPMPAVSLSKIEKEKILDQVASVNRLAESVAQSKEEKITPIEVSEAPWERKPFDSPLPSVLQSLFNFLGGSRKSQIETKSIVRNKVKSPSINQTPNSSPATDQLSENLGSSFAKRILEVQSTSNEIRTQAQHIVTNPPTTTNARVVSMDKGTAIIRPHSNLGLNSDELRRLKLGVKSSSRSWATIDQGYKEQGRFNRGDSDGESRSDNFKS